MYKVLALIIAVYLLSSGAVYAAADPGASESSPTPSVANNAGVPLLQIIESVANRLQKRFIVDSQLRGNAVVEGFTQRATSYRELQAILRVYGFAALESDDTISIVPEAILRQLPMPVVDRAPANLGDDDVVTKVMSVGKLDAITLVPLLRPLLPQYAYLSAEKSTNSLIVVARYGKIKMLESLLRDLENRPSVSKRPLDNESTPTE